jgi:hypothetical protein
MPPPPFHWKVKRQRIATWSPSIRGPPTSSVLTLSARASVAASCAISASRPPWRGGAWFSCIQASSWYQSRIAPTWSSRSTLAMKASTLWRLGMAGS